MLSDAAFYMTKAAQNLKLFYSNLLQYVTCVTYGIHRIAEKIIDTNRDINDLINNRKKGFLKGFLFIKILIKFINNYHCKINIKLNKN